MMLKDLEKVLYFESFIVLDPGLTPLDKLQLLLKTSLSMHKMNMELIISKLVLALKPLENFLKS